MRLASCMIGQEEKWGVIVKHPKREEDWIFFPEDSERVFQKCASNGTNGMFGCLRTYAPEGGWPKDMIGFLALEERGMEALRAFERHLMMFIARADQFAIESAGRRLADIKLSAPIPRPRLMWGLVQNSPSFWRKNPQRQIANFMPQGHQRPIGSIVGEDGVYDTTDGFNVELGVVIGKKGRDIPVEKAREYIAGYTIVIDGNTTKFWVDHFNVEGDTTRNEMRARFPDWYIDATTSWAGKKANAQCGMGPWITTEDEIGDVYDLLVYTLTNNVVRDRSHTAGMSIGIERTIHFYSTFATLYPGDVIHMGTMGTDGIFPVDGVEVGPETLYQAEIEGIGRLSIPAIDPAKGIDWRSEEEKHQPLAASDRYMIAHGLDELKQPWTADMVRHVWTCYGNYQDSERVEEMKPARHTRFLNGPGTIVRQNSDTIELAQRAGRIMVDPQLAFVVKKMAYKVSEAEAPDYIEGYGVMAAVTDYSIRDRIIEPATPQEKNLSIVYGRWGDGYNVIGTLGKCPAAGAKVTMQAGGQVIETTLEEYRDTPAQILSFISQGITLYPGDVIICGRMSRQLEFAPEAYAEGIEVTAAIEGLDSVRTKIVKS